MSQNVEDTSINEALELLNELAREKAGELQDIISSKYSHLKSALGGLGDRVQKEARETYAHGKEQVEELATKVDKSVHKTPWVYLGGTAVGFLILGILLGRPKK